MKNCSFLNYTIRITKTGILVRSFKIADIIFIFFHYYLTKYVKNHIVRLYYLVLSIYFTSLPYP